MAQRSLNRRANIWVARIVPVILGAIIGYASYVVTRLVCCTWAHEAFFVFMRLTYIDSGLSYQTSSLNTSPTSQGRCWNHHARHLLPPTSPGSRDLRSPPAHNCHEPRLFSQGSAMATEKGGRAARWVSTWSSIFSREELLF